MWGIIETLLGSLTVAIVMLIAFGMPIGGVIMTKRGLRTQRLGIAPHCRECDYLLIGHFGDRCPESSRARSSGLMVLVEYGDPQIDGKEVPAQRGTTSPDDPYADGDEYGLTHFITTIFKGIGSTSHSGALVIKTVGKHQLQLTVRIEIGLDKANPAKVFYLEDHKLTADFDVVAKASSASTQANQAQ
jgi:hypothetical protein